MASQQSIADYIVEQLVGTGVTARKMFGEFGLFYEGKMVALICDDQLYVKPTGAGRAFLGDCPEGQPYPRAKPHFQIPGEDCAGGRHPYRGDPKDCVQPFLSR